MWEACSALKDTPTTNVKAISREMTQVVISIKDVLREMKELNPASSDNNNNNPADDEAFNESFVETECEPCDDYSNEEEDDDDLGNDLHLMR